jgi:hypothetical protein
MPIADKYFDSRSKVHLFNGAADDQRPDNRSRISCQYRRTRPEGAGACWIGFLIGFVIVGLASTMI